MKRRGFLKFFGITAAASLAVKTDEAKGVENDRVAVPRVWTKQSDINSKEFVATAMGYWSDGCDVFGATHFCGDACVRAMSDE